MSSPLAARLRRLAFARHTLRLRLTALYGGLFLVSGAALLTITYLLVRSKERHGFFISSASGRSGGSVGFAITTRTGVGAGRQTISGSGSLVGGSGPTVLGGGHGGPGPIAPGAKAQQLMAQATHATLVASQDSQAALHALLIQSGVALAVMAVLSIGLGWIVAGRILRPLRTITNAAREISASDLHRRLALQGPDNELKQLGTTFDGLLGRLEASFAAQRQFVANASHELRTPLTLERTLVEVALADPEATVESLRATCERVLAAGETQERLIEALLTLSRSQRGLERRDPFDLAELARGTLETRAEAAAARGLDLREALEPAPTSGDARLGERLIANLLDNAIRHNRPGGSIELATRREGGASLVVVANDGPPVDRDDLPRLFRPFQRSEDERGGSDEGVGLGLSIVEAIAEAHDATLEASPGPDGGLIVVVRFPAAEPAPSPQPAGPRASGRAPTLATQP